MEILTRGGQKNKSSNSAREMPELMFLITGSWFVSRVQDVGADMRGGAGRKGALGGRRRRVVRRTELQVP